ncbi:MAG TPA: 30S ribosomal protein S9 [Candidatus Thermoplasmatota archaeon]|nr:30S ribosomal protein S9 [Candidatus Thermoplasmatota archaeon]
MTKTIVTSGKRKMAVARAAITKGGGRIRINSVPLEIHEPFLAREKIREPLVLAGDRSEKVDITVNARGGGIMGQADAIRTAIARGLVEFFGDAELKQAYQHYDRTLLVNDTRRKEPKHPLGRGARKKTQKSYR